MTKSHK